MNRRNFIKTTGLASGTLFVPQLFAKSPFAFANPANDSRILVVIQWSGGNDGLNTVVPFRNDIYYKNRPKIALKRDELLPLTDDLALHPKLDIIKKLWDNGEVAVLENVGYPEPDRSHFRSMDIWHSASDSDEYINTGWLGRWLDQGRVASSAIEMDDSLSLVMKGESQKGLAIRNIDAAKKLAAIGYHIAMDIEPHEHDQISYLRNTLLEGTQGIEYVHSQSKKFASKEIYPATELGKQLKSIAELILSGCTTRVYYVTLGGFDTHAIQPFTQNTLFNQYSQAVNSFRNDLIGGNRWKDVAVLTFSEFGRRVKENAGKGTDHGTAGVSFLFGGNIKNAGLYGGLPDLENLQDGDLTHRLDFRQVYASIIEEWMKEDSEKLLFDKFSPLRVFV